MNGKMRIRPRAFGPISRCWPLLVSLAVSTMYPIRSRDYFDRCFGLLATCLVASARCFRWFAKFVCVCFCAACFCFCFGDLSPMTFTLPRPPRIICGSFFRRLRCRAVVLRRRVGHSTFEVPMAETLVIASANNLSVKYGTQVVLDDATIAFTEGEHIGLVGRNGSGKSTFLQIAAGVAQADSGEFTRRRDLVTGYMPQVSGLDDAATVHANILSGAQRILDLITEYERVPGDSPLSATLLDQIIQADGWNLEHRIKSLITNLHAPESDRVVGTLSGGERRRVALCRALLARPDFLILDEPTNHLDTGSIEWLEDFLARYAGTCLFVTHDRYFLDRVATRIVELSRGQFISYDGNYTDYLLARVRRQAVEEMQEHKRQKFLKRELQWVRRAPRARRTKSVDRVERYFEMAAQDAPEAELDVELIIPTPPKPAARGIGLRHVCLELGGRTLFFIFFLIRRPARPPLFPSSTITVSPMRISKVAVS